MVKVASESTTCEFTNKTTINRCCVVNLEVEFRLSSKWDKEIHCFSSESCSFFYKEIFFSLLFSEFAMANVTCEYDSSASATDNTPGRRIRRSEAILRQAAECVSRGQTFQTVSDMFHIPISTIRSVNSNMNIMLITL